MPESKKPGAVDLLKEDHREVEDLFKQFEKAKDETQKEEVADEIDLKLRVHSLIDSFACDPISTQNRSSLESRGVACPT